MKKAKAKQKAKKKLTKGQAKEKEIDFIQTSFLKVMKTAETCIVNGKDVSNTLIILKKDYSVNLVDICDKGVKEIRDLLPTYEMLGYVYAIECLKINKDTRKKRKVISIGVCKSDFYMRMDIEFKDNKIINKTLLKGRSKDDVDVLDLWGNLDIVI